MSLLIRQRSSAAPHMNDDGRFYFLSDYRVPLAQISETQLTLCHPERELLPLVLSHCHYTLKKGGETSPSYDLSGIQTQLCRRFLAGKPLIQEVKTKTNRTQMCRRTRRCANRHCVLLDGNRTRRGTSAHTCRISPWFCPRSGQRFVR